MKVADLLPSSRTSGFGQGYASKPTCATVARSTTLCPSSAIRPRLADLLVSRFTITRIRRPLLPGRPVFRQGGRRLLQQRGGRSVHSAAHEGGLRRCGAERELRRGRQPAAVLQDYRRGRGAGVPETGAAYHGEKLPPLVLARLYRLAPGTEEVAILVAVQESQAFVYCFKGWRTCDFILEGFDCALPMR